MKRLALLLIFLSLSRAASATVTHSVTKTVLIMDTSAGTFVDAGTTYGLITGVFYTVVATDGVTGNTCAVSSQVDFSSPQNSFPTKTQLLNQIQADVQAKGFKGTLLSCLTQKNSVTRFDAANKISGIDNGTINP